MIGDVRGDVARRIRLVGEATGAGVAAVGPYHRAVAFERISVDPNKMGGLPYIRDLRVAVGMVLSQLAAGSSVDDVLGGLSVPGTC